jgi:hypothetical protein
VLKFPDLQLLCLFEDCITVNELRDSNSMNFNFG